MAYYVNVAEWNPEQVADWLRGNKRLFMAMR